jgi:hypothetical protein
MTWEEAVAWQEKQANIAAWDKGYAAAMRYCTKAVVGHAIASPANPYETEENL